MATTTFSTKDLLFTLDVCRSRLPYGTNPVHFERLQHIEQILKSQPSEQEEPAP